MRGDGSPQLGTGAGTAADADANVFDASTLNSTLAAAGGNALSATTGGDDCTGNAGAEKVAEADTFASAETAAAVGAGAGVEADDDDEYSVSSVFATGGISTSTIAGPGVSTVAIPDEEATAPDSVR